MIKREERGELPFTFSFVFPTHFEAMRVEGRWRTKAAAVSPVRVPGVVEGLHSRGKRRKRLSFN